MGVLLMKVIAKTISSLEKIFLDENQDCKEYITGSALKGEIFSFQLVYKMDTYEVDRLKAKLIMDSPLNELIHLYTVEWVPSELPAYQIVDDDYLRTTPGLYPDVLEPYREDIDITFAQWHSVWVSVETTAQTPAGNYPIQLSLVKQTDETEVLTQSTFTLEVLNVQLPSQTLIHTEWFHCDCIAVQYDTPVFSERHWELMERYMRNAAKYGINMILTPLFTPPLDTKVGGERPTVQLVDVAFDDGQYYFGFSNLKRYMDMAKASGIRYFEMSHLFTQWGVKAAPKIMAKVNGTIQKLFGWETDAGSLEYRTFLQVFLTKLKSFLISEGEWEQCYFHVSDEPSLSCLENYQRAADILKTALGECHIMDALSDYTFYEKGIVQTPIPSNNHVDTFLEHGIKNLWTYYCCGQYQDVSNRFMSMPSYRNRILGYQLYKFDIVGFLQWGYNFWFCQLSERPIDPYRVTDSGRTFPSGDAFIVYPGKEFPVPSIRQLVFYEGLQDMRALQLLQTVMDKESVVALIDDVCGQPLAFKKYPKSAEVLLNLRQVVNKLIKEKLVKYE